MRLYKFDQAVVKVSGNAEKFLNGLTSNSLDRPRNAFLNQHGRIIATFDQVKSGADEFLLVISPPAWEPLKAHADKYARLNKTSLEIVPLNVYFDLTGEVRGGPGEQAIPQKKGQILLTSRSLPATISSSEFTLFRLEYQIPVQGIDYRDEMVLNVDEHEFVSFSKGCFLGQEPVAKVHNRSKPTWKLSVKFLDELGPEQQPKMTSRFKEEGGRTKGFIFVANH